ncbi:hypothetical protein KM043_013586 [Ampulex compressa]|nr:hypothetical protein KM043_013586 [Ampulex compressa]
MAVEFGSSGWKRRRGRGDCSGFACPTTIPFQAIPRAPLDGSRRTRIGTAAAFEVQEISSLELSTISAKRPGGGELSFGELQRKLPGKKRKNSQEIRLKFLPREPAAKPDPIAANLPAKIRQRASILGSCPWTSINLATRHVLDDVRTVVGRASSHRDSHGRTSGPRHVRHEGDRGDDSTGGGGGGQGAPRVTFSTMLLQPAARMHAVPVQDHRCAVATWRVTVAVRRRRGQAGETEQKRSGRKRGASTLAKVFGLRHRRPRLITSAEPPRGPCAHASNPLLATLVDPPRPPRNRPRLSSLQGPTAWMWRGRGRGGGLGGGCKRVGAGATEE